MHIIIPLHKQSADMATRYEIDDRGSILRTAKNVYVLQRDQTDSGTPPTLLPNG